MQKNPHISFLIVNYKSKDALIKCISSMRAIRGSQETFEFLVGNNEETPLALTDSLVGDDLCVVENNSNIGFAAAHNILAHRAKGRYLCFLNPDTSNPSADFSHIVQSFKDENVGILSPMILTPQGDVQKDSFGDEVTPLQIIRENLFPQKHYISRNETKEVSWVTGAALFIKREVFQEVGGFDENFFLYYEDVDLCRRVRKAGYRVLVDPRVSITHTAGHSSGDKKTQKKYYFASQKHYFTKYYGACIAGLLNNLRKVTHKK